MQLQLLGWTARALFAVLVSVLSAAVLAQTSSNNIIEPQAAQDLLFRDLLVMPVGRKGIEPSAKALALNGKRVRITGYMVAQERAYGDQFFFTPMPVRMSEDADGEADDLPPQTVVVMMPTTPQQIRIQHTPGLMRLTGQFEYGRQEHEDGRISWFRLYLEPLVK